MVVFIFDVETTGFPKKNSSWKDPSTFDSCRIVSICWEVLNEETKQVEIKKTFLIKPEGFKIPQHATNIHGITTEHAKRMGHNVEYVLKEFEADLKKWKPKTIVAHNIMFDINAILSEITRLGKKHLITRILKLSQFCTMKQGRNMLKLKRNPSLEALYKQLLDKRMENAHNADADVAACRECFKKMML